MNEPNWNLLPSQPREFFGLPNEFDRKTLKRAYNKLIRVYKPEKFPNEFQRIRAAFEQLENALRYGNVAVSAQELTAEYAWRPDASIAPKEIDKSPKPTKLSALQLLEKGSPAQVYQHLSKQKQKSPYDFFALATLADLVTQDQNLYFKWILTGIKEHANDPGLIALLYEFFKRERPAKLLTSMLMTTSKIVTNDRFYFITEKAWLRLLTQIPFSDFKRLLAQCESNLKIIRNDSQMVFYAEILKAAVWNADDEWFSQRLGFLNQNAARSGRLDYELEVLDVLNDYQKEYAASKGKCAIRDRIFESIKAYFQLEEAKGDAKVIECQNELVNDAHGLLSAFEKVTDTDPYMISVWSMINDDVAQRNGIRLGVGESPKREKSFRTQLFRLLQDLNETWQFGGKDFFFYLVLLFGSYFLVLVAPFFFLYNWLNGAIFLVALLLAVIGLVLNHFLLYPKTVLPIFQRYMARRVQRIYQRDWRDRFIQLFDATGATTNELLPVMARFLDNEDRFGGAITWLADLVYQDAGLKLYSMAAPFRR
jgi:hypothetical protein